ARGRAIAKAVDVVEVVRRRFVQNAVVEKVNIGTEEGRVGNDGRQRNVHANRDNSVAAEDGQVGRRTR
ncbi:MAG: hypothetical protein RMH74_07725, partial [Candidatus Caldarchaeum sp.]|nr:hypothetical protein [Candidatus Caldarchaeum sp.]